MNIPKKWHEHLEIDMNNEVYRVVSAEHKDMNFDVFKENTYGERFCRNLYRYSYGGYVVAFPGRPFSRYDCSRAEEEEWGECGNVSVGPMRTVTEAEKDLLARTYDGFGYVLAKWQNPTLAQIFDILPFWREHKEVELLVACGYAELATKKGFYRLSDAKRKAVCRWIGKHRENFPILKLSEILAVLKNKISDEEYLQWDEVRTSCFNKSITRDFAKYLRKQAEKFGTSYSEIYSLHNEFCRIAIRLGKDMSQEYWSRPGNLYEAHNKVLAEYETLRRLEEEARNLQKKKDMESDLGKLKRLAGRLGKFNAEVDGYTIYFSDNFDDWNKQATTLHQCIIASNYIGEMVSNRYRIAFIRKDDEPVATVEIRPGNKIGQFYANELDRNNCRPNEEVTAAVNKWIAGLPVLIKERKTA